MSAEIVPSDISLLSFDSFDRDARRDVVCLAPIRTTIRREEEIVLVRKVRKAEAIEALPACPVNSQEVPSIPRVAPNYYSVDAPQAQSVGA